MIGDVEGKRDRQERLSGEESETSALSALSAEKGIRMLDFRDWLVKARVTDDLAGDLVSDLRSDSRLPAGIKSAEELRSYLRSRGACQEALDAVLIVWKRYESA
jgi:hypothetical protein